MYIYMYIYNVHTYNIHLVDLTSHAEAALPTRVRGIFSKSFHDLAEILESQYPCIFNM